MGGQAVVVTDRTVACKPPHPGNIQNGLVPQAYNSWVHPDKTMVGQKSTIGVWVALTELATITRMPMCAMWGFQCLPLAD